MCVCVCVCVCERGNTGETGKEKPLRARRRTSNNHYYFSRSFNPCSLLRRGSFSGETARKREKERDNGEIKKIGGARGTMGRAKRKEPLPYNVFKMAPVFRESLGLEQVLTTLFTTWRMKQNVVFDKSEFFSPSLKVLFSVRSRTVTLCVVSVSKAAALLISSHSEVI